MFTEIHNTGKAMAVQYYALTPPWQYMPYAEQSPCLQRDSAQPMGRLPPPPLVHMTTGDTLLLLTRSFMAWCSAGTPVFAKSTAVECILASCSHSEHLMPLSSALASSHVEIWPRLSFLTWSTKCVMMWETVT